METPTEAPPVNNSLAVKEEFLNKARNIEQYEESHLEYASTQSEMNRESQVVYEKWDTLLNEIYQYLKNTLPANEFAVLQSDEQAWIIEKEAAADDALSEWQGGSAAPAMVNGTKAEYTKNRCDYLISQIR